MKRTTILFLAFLALVVAISGCVGKQAAQTNTQTSTSANTGGVSGEIPAADSSGITVETPQASADENVDLGSLI